MKQNFGFGQSGTAAEDHIKKIYREQNQEDRQRFIDKISKIDHSRVLYIDEAGIDNRLRREYGRAPRGEKIYADIPGKKRERISIIGGWIEKKFIAPITFTGRCNKEVFNVWLEQILLPQLKRGTTIVMDNATFHKTAKTKELIEKASALSSSIFSEFEPYCWHTIKSRLRPRMYQQENLFLFVGQAITEVYHLFLKVLYLYNHISRIVLLFFHVLHFINFYTIFLIYQLQPAKAGGMSKRLKSRLRVLKLRDVKAIMLIMNFLLFNIFLHICRIYITNSNSKISSSP